MGFHIDAVHAFVMVGDDGDEGIPAFLTTEGVMMPLIAADLVRLERLRPMAAQIGRAAGKPVTLVRFHQRQDLEVIRP